MTTSKLFLFFLYLAFTSVSQAAIIPFFNQSDWENTLSNPVLIEQDFLGASTSFSANSLDNNIGVLSVTLNGGVGDPGQTGLTGKGFFQSEVDSSGTDALSIDISFDSTYGFALTGLQNDSLSNKSSLALDEIAISIGLDYWVLSEEMKQNTSNIPFLGFVSDELIDSFSFFHAGLVRQVNKESEEFFLEGLIIAKSTVSVDEPSVILLLMTGLLFPVVVRNVKVLKRLEC
ncbi:MAG: hypothetical protein HN349_19375 [Gammaproteobacteria bacterium]|jgi:hypothetical protein|nr:hypothetical protein [Gammaproteobacteria bacterium]MBT4076741.1 hypothetical protein [Gammaproteobacteria bacterium]